MRHMVLFFLLLATPIYAAAWTPPADPDPQKILNEAREDACAKRYQDALAKHVWFHQNVLAIQPAFYGVRLSFALSDWYELAKKYPPAMEKLVEMRDKAKRRVIDGRDIYSSFHDMESINGYLGEDVVTKDLFVLLDKQNPTAAKSVFDLAQASLIQSKAFKLLGNYIVPKRDFTNIKESYRYHKQIANIPRFGKDHLTYAHKNFAHDSTTLVAILAVNNRKEEAQEIADLARVEWDNKNFHAALEKALQGIVPAPWP